LNRILQAALDAASVGRTTVVVAHRLSTVKGADAIAVVQQARRRAARARIVLRVWFGGVPSWNEWARNDAACL
jgi:ABC-type protease/lipase transport system fused ATPase/permease subunit